MEKTVLWLILVVICVYSQLKGGHAKSSKLVNRHENGSELKRDLIARNRGSLQLEDNINAKQNKRGFSSSADNTINNGKQISSKLIHEGRITTEDYLKTLTQPKQVSKDIETNERQPDVTAKEKSKIGKSYEETGDAGTVQKVGEDISTARKEFEGQKEQKKSEIEIPKEMKSKGNLNREIKHKVSHSAVEKSSNTLKKDNIGQKNSKKIGSQHNDERKVETNLTESKTTASTNTKVKEKSQKKAKKILVTFFHNELDDVQANATKTHVVKDTQHAERAHETNTHVVMKNESTQIKSPNTNTQHTEVAHEKKSHVVKENGKGRTNTEDDSPSTHTKDEESTLAEISDKVYKRTRLQQLQPQVTNVNNKVIEMVLPSGSRAEAPQHIRLSSEPTHVIFKPVHKYYPAIHRYMTKPIERYLNKPVDLSGITPPLEGAGEGFTSTPQVKGYNGPPLIQHNVGIPKVVANNPVSGGLGEVKQYTSPPGRVIQSSVGEKIPEGLVNDQAPPAPQVKHYDSGSSPRIAPGGLGHDQHAVPVGAARVGPVRIFPQLPPRIQPVLVHPHRLSPSG